MEVEDNKLRVPGAAATEAINAGKQVCITWMMYEGKVLYWRKSTEHPLFFKSSISVAGKVIFHHKHSLTILNKKLQFQ